MQFIALKFNIKLKNSREASEESMKKKLIKIYLVYE